MSRSSTTTSSEPAARCGALLLLSGGVVQGAHHEHEDEWKSTASAHSSGIAKADFYGTKSNSVTRTVSKGADIKNRAHGSATALSFAGRLRPAPGSAATRWPYIFCRGFSVSPDRTEATAELPRVVDGWFWVYYLAIDFPLGLPRRGRSRYTTRNF